VLSFVSFHEMSIQRTASNTVIPFVNETLSEHKSILVIKCLNLRVFCNKKKSIDDHVHFH
jgi:hypothetical protein